MRTGKRAQVDSDLLFPAPRGADHHDDATTRRTDRAYSATFWRRTMERRQPLTKPGSHVLQVSYEFGISEALLSLNRASAVSPYGEKHREHRNGRFLSPHLARLAAHP